MKINREKLLEALKVASSVAGRRITLPILSCVKVHTKSGRLRVRGTDIERDVTTEIDCDGELPPVCIPLRLFSAFSSECSGDTVEFAEENRWLKCSDSTTDAVLPCHEAKDFPPEPSEKQTAIGVNTKDIADGISAVVWACGSDVNDFVVSCVRIYARGNKVVCEAADRKTLAHFSRNSIAADFDIILPSQSAVCAIDALNRGGAVLSVGENSITINYDGGSFSAKLAKVKPLATEHLLSLPRESLGRVKREDLLSALSVCLIPDGSSLFQIEFQFSSTGLTLECEESGFRFKRFIPGQFVPRITRLNVERAHAAIKSIKSDVLEVFSIETVLGFGFEDGLATVARVRKVVKGETQQ